MIWRKLLGVPKDGGGNLQRFLEVRKQLFIKNWTETSLTSDKIFKGPITLFDFARHHDQADAHVVSTTRGSSRGWKISDDGSFGGFSRGHLQLYADEQNQSGIDVDVDAEINDELNSETSNVLENDPVTSKSSSTGFQPFVRWKGTLSTRLPTPQPDKKQINRSGYCYIRLPEFPLGGVPLKSKYNALEIKCRSPDSHLYAVNLKVSTFLPDDLYQGFVQFNSDEEEEETGLKKENIPVEFRTDEAFQSNSSKKESKDGKFVRLVLPFRDFVLTAGGRPREYQRVLDGDVTVEHIGFMLADGQDGEFEFDLARIRVVNHSDGEIIDDDDYDDYEKEEEMNKSDEDLTLKELKA